MLPETDIRRCLLRVPQTGCHHGNFGPENAQTEYEGVRHGTVIRPLTCADG
jgi:hypothetical protein